MTNLPQSIDNRYQIIKELVKDSISITYNVFDLINYENLILKTLNYEWLGNNDDISNYLNFINQLSAIENIGLIKPFSVKIVSENKLCYITYENSKGESLETLIKKEKYISFPRAVNIFIQLIHFLYVFYSRGFLHLYLNPRNIIIEKEEDNEFVRIMDYGFYKLLGEKKYHEVQLLNENIQYVASEQLEWIESDIDQKSDLYSAVAIFYEMLTGNKPFNSYDIIEIQKKKLAVSIDLLDQANLPKRIIDIIYKMLHPDPNKRYINTREIMTFISNYGNFIKKPKGRVYFVFQDQGEYRNILLEKEGKSSKKITTIEEIKNLVEDKLDRSCTVTNDISNFIWEKVKYNNYNILKKILSILISEKIIYIDEKGNIVFDKEKASLLDFNIIKKSAINLNLLDERLKRVLQAASVIEERFTPSIIKELIDYPLDEIEKSLEEAKKKFILVKFDESYYFSLLEFREIFYNLLEEEEKKLLHLKAYQIFEKSEKDETYQILKIVEHLKFTSENDKFLNYLIKASIILKERGEYEKAIYCLEEAKNISKERHVYAKIEENLGDIYTEIGKYKEAEKIYSNLIEYYSSLIAFLGKSDLNRIKSKLGFVYHMLGLHYQSIKVLGDVLINYGTSIPTKFRPRYFFFELFKMLLPKFIKRLIYRIKNEENLIKALSVISEASVYIPLIPTAIISSMKLFNVAEAIGKDIEKAVAYISHSVVCSITPFTERGEYFFLKAQKIFENYLYKELKGEYAWYYGIYKGREGVYYYLTNSYNQAITSFEECISIQKYFASQPSYYIYRFLSYIYWLKGDLDKHYSYLEEMYQISKKNQNFRDMADACSMKAMNCFLRGENEKAYNIIKEMEDIYKMDNAPEKAYLYWYIKGCIKARIEDDLNEALQCFNKSIEVLKKNKIKLVSLYLQIYIHQTQAKILHESQQKEKNRSNISHKIKVYKLGKICKKILKATKKWKNFEGQAYRLMGIFHQHFSTSRRAKEYYEKSINILMGYGFNYELATSYFNFGHFLIKQNDKLNGIEYIKKSIILFKKIGSILDIQYIYKICGDEGIELGEVEVEEEKDALKDKAIEKAILKINENIPYVYDINILLKNSLNEIISLMGALQGAVLVIEGKKLKVVIGYDWQRKDITSYIKTDKKILNIIEEIEKDLLKYNGKFNENSYLKDKESILWAPLVYSNKIIGAIFLEKFYYTKFSIQDGKRLEKFANHISVSLQLVEFVKEKERQIAIKDTIREISSSLASHTIKEFTSLNDILNKVLARLNYNRALIFLLEKYIKNQPNYDESLSKNLKCCATQIGENVYHREIVNFLNSFTINIDLINENRDKNGIFYKAFYSKEPILIPDIKKMNYSLVAKEKKFFNLSNSKSLLFSPIRFEEETLGVLYVDQLDESAILTQDDAMLLQSIANNLALAIKQAEAIKQLERRYEILLAKVSHDIRSPLSLTKDFAMNAIYMIDQNGKNEFVKEELQKSLAILNLAIEIANNLVEESKIDMGKVSLKISMFDIKELAMQVIGLIHSLNNIYYKGISVELICKISDTIIYGDKTRVGQIIFNLLHNAYKFSKENEKIEIVIDKKGKSSKNNILLSVIDKGCGIPKEEIEKITERFYSGNTRQAGMGLGLSIVKKYVEDFFKGKLYIESVVGEGSKFTIILPRYLKVTER